MEKNRLDEVSDRLNRVRSAVEGVKSEWQKIAGEIGRGDSASALRSLGAVSDQMNKHLDCAGREIDAALPLCGLPPPPTPLSPEELVRQVRALIESTNGAQPTVPEAEVTASLKSVEMDVKSLIIVETNKAKLILPTLDRPINPEQLSTIHLVFGAVPYVRRTTGG